MTPPTRRNAPHAAAGQARSAGPTGPARPGGPLARVTPSRRVAYDTLRRVLEQGAYADRALHAEAAALGPRDRALATTLVYGTVQRLRTLDYVLAQLSDRRLDRTDAPVLQALRLGLFQLLFLEGITEYAAVHESVELAKRASRGGSGLVNAVLRRATREGRQLVDALTDATPAQAALKRSVPDWLAELWWAELGPDDARALMAHVNSPAETAIRVNTLRARPSDVIDALPVAVSPAEAPLADLPGLPEGLVLAGPFDVLGSEAFIGGKILPQSRASMLVARVLDPQPGERVLDLCAAPGGKTTHAAALMGGEGEITAVEVHPGRARALADAARRVGAGNIQVTSADGRTFQADHPFDRVIVDPPCSGLGTLQSRPDLRWQPRRGEIESLADKQGELLRSGARALRPGGTLVYSVCTITRAEGPGVIDRFLSENPAFSLERSWQLLPHRDGTDGFYIALLHS